MSEQKYLLVRVAFDARVASVEPLGLEYLAGVLKEEGKDYVFHDEILHNRFFRFSRIIKKISKHGITCVCFTVISDRAEYILKMIAKLKKIKPDLKIIVGGPEANINYKDFFLDNIDFVCYDHGLESFRYAVANDFNLEFMAKAKGLAYKNNGE